MAWLAALLVFESQEEYKLQRDAALIVDITCIKETWEGIPQRYPTTGNDPDADIEQITLNYHLPRSKKARLMRYKGVKQTSVV